MSLDLGKTCRAEVHGIYFAFGSAKLVGESDLALSEISKVLAANPAWVVTVEGHTDSIGTHAANLDLSKRRAAAVRDALVTRFGVASATPVGGRVRRYQARCIHQLSKAVHGIAGWSSPANAKSNTRSVELNARA